MLNIGSGKSSTILEVANKLIKVMSKGSIQPQGYEPEYTLESGLLEMLDWLSSQTAEDRFAIATRELEGRGLTV